LGKSRRSLCILGVFVGVNSGVRSPPSVTSYGRNSFVLRSTSSGSLVMKGLRTGLDVSNCKLDPLEEADDPFRSGVLSSATSSLDDSRLACLNCWMSGTGRGRCSRNGLGGVLGSGMGEGSSGSAANSLRGDLSLFGVLCHDGFDKACLATPFRRFRRPPWRSSIG